MVTFFIAPADDRVLPRDPRVLPALADAALATAVRTTKCRALLIPMLAHMHNTWCTLEQWEFVSRRGLHLLAALTCGPALAVLFSRGVALLSALRWQVKTGVHLEGRYAGQWKRKWVSKAVEAANTVKAVSPVLDCRPARVVRGFAQVLPVAADHPPGAAAFRPVARLSDRDEVLDRDAHEEMLRSGEWAGLHFWWDPTDDVFLDQDADGLLTRAQLAAVLLLLTDGSLALAHRWGSLAPRSQINACPSAQSSSPPRRGWSSPTASATRTCGC